MPYKDPKKNLECQRKYRESHREDAKKYAKEYLMNNPSDPKEAHRRKLKHKYGITSDEYGQMFEKQKGCCAICGMHQLGFKTRLCVDHNHSTGQIRKLLCGNCNWALGHAKENVVILQNMISYLKSFSEESI